MTITIGTRVRIDDPTWYRHGDTGTVIKVNRRTIKVQMDSDPVDIVIGSPIYFEELDAPAA